MTELTIVTLGDPVLRQAAEAVAEIDEGTRSLVGWMYATMYGAGGQGLAAPQVGVSLRLAVVDVPPQGERRFVLINPRIVSASDERSRGVEGCLSVPGVWELVERPARVLVEAMDLTGRPCRIEAAGELARCLQHEIDHLDGVLYIDRLSPLPRRMLLRKYRKLQDRAGHGSRHR